MNIVRNTNAEGTETYRERSRIGSINHRIWSVIAPMLFIAFGLFGVNVEAWGLDQYVTMTDFDGSTSYNGGNLNSVNNGTFSKTENHHAKFSINGLNKYNKNRLEFGEIGSYPGSKSSTFSWGVDDDNYNVSVTGVSVNVRAYQPATSTKKATATLSGGGQSSTTTECQTNSLGDTDGAKTASISNSSGISSATLTVNTTSKPKVMGFGVNTTFHITSVTYTYKVTHKEYLFGFSASTGVNNGSYGTATAEVANETVQAAVGVKEASTTATFTATPTAGCQFLGWSTSQDGSAGYESTANPYKPTIKNSTAGSTAKKTLYAIFDNKQPQSITWKETLTGKVRGKVFTLNATASSGLAVTYTASPADLVSISGNQVTCLKAGTVTITANQAGNSIYHPSSNTPAKSFTIIEHAITKKPTATGITFEQTLSNSALSGGTANVDGTWAWKTPNIVPNAGTANYVAVFTPSSSVISAYPLECNVSVTVSKAEADVACSIVASYYVDDANLDLQSLWTREGDGTITYSVEDFDGTGVNNELATTPAITDNRYLSLGQAGNLRIKMAIAEGTNYNSKTVTKDIVINKRPNTIYVKGDVNYSSSIYVDSYDNGLILTADNTDYTNCPITNTQDAGSDVATFYQNDKVVYSSYKLGKATWTLSQPENYKYQAGNGSFTVNVIQQPEATDCYVLNDENTYDWGTYGEQVYNFTERGVKLFYEIKRTAILGVTDNVAWNLYYYDDYDAQGNELKKISLSVSDRDKWYSFTEDTYFSDKVRSVKFASEFGAAGNHFVRNVKVTRETWLNVGTDNSATNGTLTIDKKADGESAIYPGEKGQKSTTVYWSIASGGDLKIKCDDPRFTFSQNTITDVNCKSGTTDITVYYEDSVAGTVTATATVYNDVYNRTFTVKGVIVKADQSMTWNNDILRLGQSYNNVATANTLVTYESDDESIIRVDEDDEGHKTILTAVGTGTVNITATAEESSFYAEKSDTKSIKVTEKQIQWIDWNQSLFGLKLGGANVTMNAVAASDVEGCVSSRLIEYSSNNESVVKVVNNNQLQIIGVGTAIITAVQAGGFDTDGHDYERAETEKTVIVRDPNAPCESFAYQQGQEVKMECGWNALNKQTRISEINFNGIVPATGTLRYKGEKQTVWPVDYFDGTMTVEQYIPGENWKPVTGGDLGKPSIGTYKTANLTFDRRATKMRVKVTDGLGYHYFTDCQVTQARFIETTAPVDFNLNVGQQQNQVIYLSYSNITDGLSLTLAQGANSHFSVDKSFIEGSCGSAAKNVALTITYHPTAEETNAQDVLTITDGTTSCQVVLTGSATRVNRHIIWDHADETNIYTVQTETLSAEARTDLNELAGVVTFSLASSSTATGAISMENVLSFTSAGVANVVAYTTDDARYNAAPNVTKVFNVSKTPTTISTLPVLAAVTSGTAVGDVELTGWQVTNTVNGGVVEGTLAITSADLINVGTNTVTLTFTPSNTDMYVGCTSTTTIVVNKAPSVATPSAANIVYGQKVSASLLSNVGTDGTWAWNTGNNEAVLDAGTHEGLAVHFTPTSGNYTELDATVSLTVDKANPAVTPQATDITYGQPVSASNITTASGDVAGSWAWAVDEEQVLSVGDHVLKANFTSTNANYSNLSDVDVTLKVKKIEKLEVEVPLSFCAGGEVNFHGNTYSEAGEYQVEAEGATRDTVYNVTVTKLQPTTGTDSKTITVGANESWNGINLSGYAVGSHEVVFHTENAAGCDSTVTLSLTVVPLSNVFTNAAGNGDWEDPNNWQSGIVPTSDPDIIVTGALEVNEDITVGSLTIESTGSVAVISGGTLTVNGTSEDRTEYGDVHVMSDGALALGNSADLQVRDFTLDAALGNSSNAATSGQVSGDVNLHINRDAYFQMSFDPRGYITLGWYDMTVPFEVEVLNGVYDNYMNKLTNGVDYLIMSYDEVKRASSGNGWALFNGTMQPGHIYTITLDDAKTWNTFIFKKKSGSNLLSNGSCTAQYSSIGEAKDRGWNGLGNGTLQHRELAGLSGRKVQVYNFQEKIYEAFDADEKAYAVGTAFFVQADANMGTIDLTTTDGTKALRAPQYASRALDEFRLTLTAEGEDRYTDRMWVSASEEATGEYVIGHDLLKMGTPKDAKVAQMWTVNNDLRLCDIEMPLMDDKAQCPISFFAPQAQTYEIAVDQAPEDATLYLTYNDRIIWSLSASPYTIDLAKGMTEGYGLRIVARHNAPSVATGMDELNVDEDGNRKVLIDNMLYIITPEGAMYSVTGEKVK